MRRSAVILGLVVATLGAAELEGQFPLWQADVQIRSLVVVEAGGNLTARLVVAAELGEALGTRVEVLLPVGVGIVSMGTGCAPGPNRTGIRELRSRVECDLGTLPARSRRELYVITTAPPDGVTRGFAAVVLSDTPDPRLGNNFAERTIVRGAAQPATR